jgi:hypothetical protein
MTITSDSLLAPNSEFDSAGPVMLKARGGRRMMLRTAQRLLGASATIAALALWLFPVGAGGTAEVLSKVMITLVLGFIGAALWQSGSLAPSPEIEVDMIRREVRLVRWFGETKSLVTRRRFADLSGAAFEGRNVKLWDEDGELLAELTLPDDGLVASLRRAMEESRMAAEAAEQVAARIAASQAA